MSTTEDLMKNHTQSCLPLKTWWKTTHSHVYHWRPDERPHSVMPEPGFDPATSHFQVKYVDHMATPPPYACCGKWQPCACRSWRGGEPSGGTAGTALLYAPHPTGTSGQSPAAVATEAWTNRIQCNTEKDKPMQSSIMQLVKKNCTSRQLILQCIMIKCNAEEYSTMK